MLTPGPQPPLAGARTAALAPHAPGGKVDDTALGPHAPRRRSRFPHGPLARWHLLRPQAKRCPATLVAAPPPSRWVS